MRKALYELKHCGWLYLIVNLISLRPAWNAYCKWKSSSLTRLIPNSPSLFTFIAEGSDGFKTWTRFCVLMNCEQNKRENVCQIWLFLSFHSSIYCAPITRQAFSASLAENKRITNKSDHRVKTEVIIVPIPKIKS